MCKEMAKELRSKLKELGYNRNMVGVTSDRYSINVTVKSLEVDFKRVENLANNYERIERDHMTGEILCGCNTYVNVSYSSALQNELKENYKTIANELWNKIQSSEDDSITLFVSEDKTYFVSYYRDNNSIRLVHKIDENSCCLDNVSRYVCYNENYVIEALVCFFLYHNFDILTVNDKKEVEIVTENKQEVKENENTNTEINTIVKSDENANCKVVFNEDKNGIELHFNDKPNEEIRNKIKSIGFRWSKFNKVWYIKDSQKVRDQLQQIGLLNTNNDSNVIISNIEVPEIKLTEINETNFNIDKTISKRENDGHWTFRTKERNHQQEILNYLNGYKKDYINTIQPLENKTNKNYYNRWFNSFMNRYYNNYYNRLKADANNPSWVVTGRAGRNANKDKKHMNRYDNLMRELLSLEDEFKTKIGKIKSAIQKEKNEKIKTELNGDLNVKSLDNNLTKQKIDINRQSVENIFENSNVTVNCYNYKDQYYIIKNWGYWRLYNKEGNEIEVLGRCHKSLIECKKTLLYTLTHSQQYSG